MEGLRKSIYAETFALQIQKPLVRCVELIAPESERQVRLHEGAGGAPGYSSKPWSLE